MQLDLNTVIEIIIVPIGLYVGKIVKTYADDIIDHTTKANSTLIDHAQKMADLSISLKQSDSSHTIDSESLKSEIKNLKDDLRSVQRSIESRTENLEQGLKFVVSIRGEVNDMTGSISRINKDIQGLTIRADTQSRQMETVAKILNKTKG